MTVYSKNYIENTKTAFDGGSCEWTKGESNPKSRLINPLPAPAGLGPRIHVPSIASCNIKSKELPVRSSWRTTETDQSGFINRMPIIALWRYMSIALSTLLLIPKA